MDEQLCWCWKFEAFHSVSILHMDMQCVRTLLVWLELLLVQRRIMHLPPCCDPSRAADDTACGRGSSLY